MTTFIYGNEGGLFMVQPTRYGFVTNHWLLCTRHDRGQALQPFTSFDAESGYGQGGCPFCPGGPLAGQFHRYRSQKGVYQAVLALPPKGDPHA